MNKNQEGYHDPTACKAVRKVNKHRKKIKRKHDSLTYKLKEIKGFDQFME